MDERLGRSLTRLSAAACSVRGVDSQLFETDPPPAPREATSFTVGQLNQLIGRALEQIFPDDLWVEGEISNLNRSRAGHVYFDLIEPTQPGVASTAKISVVLFSQTKQIVNNQLKRQNVGAIKDGMAVRIRAAVDFYETQGRLQLRMTGIDPRYILAAMAAERDELIRRLAEEGVTERNKAVPMPLVPLRVGLVTSRGSAAEADFMDELAGCAFGFQVVVCDSRVQGDLAPQGLIAGLRTLYARGDLDVIAVIRGGGSRGDLAVFDNETLARTIAAAPVPVFTGVGHEIDTSVADHVAHAALKTPTAVAAALVGCVAHYVEHVETQWHAITHVARAQTTLAEQRLSELAKRSARAGRDGLTLADQRLNARGARAAQAGRRTIALAEQQLDTQLAELPKLTHRIIRTATADLGHIEARLHASDPAVLLKRGWSITRAANGDVVRTVGDVRTDDTLVTEVSDGTIISSASFVEPSPVDPEKDTTS